jgi:4-amino-4-deoxy-L-arabinose transferase-like glycosyltransferase
MNLPTQNVGAQTMCSLDSAPAARRWQLILFAVAATYMAFSLATISFYNLPFCDEVYYADAAFSYHQTGTFAVPIDFPRTSGAVFQAPLFLWLQAKVFDLAGFGMWQVRLMPLLAGMLVFGLYSALVYRYTKSRFLTFLFMLLFITDRAINFNLHSGRMEMPSLLLAALSMLVFQQSLRITRSSFSLIMAIVAGLLLSAAFLLSFRMAIAAIPCVFLLVACRPAVITLYIRNLLVYGIVAAIPCGAWLYIAFGGPVSAYAHITGKQSFDDHFGVLSSFVGNILRRPAEAPKMLLFYACSAFLLLKHRQWIRSEFFICMSFLITLGFVMFVSEGGSYRAMLFPFIYLLILVSIARLRSLMMARIDVFCVIVLICINLLYGIPRALYWAIHWNSMDHNNLTEEVAAALPQGSRVITDPVFYYALRAAKCDIIIPYWGISEYFEEYVKNDFKPDYILSARGIFEDWFPGKTDKVAVIGSHGDEPNWAKSLLRLESVLPETVYSAPLIKIVD